ncbi:MAG: porin [Pedobacter sp.]|nr:MAG: porin [Pedobacter sp.]
MGFTQNNNAPSSVDPHEVKITGYLQTQYQKAGSPGIVSFSGGDFSTNSSERFMIRRGRLKIDRVDKFTNIVFQIDATQNGVQLMDAFIQLHAPGLPGLTFTGGLFNRPFGHSVIYSSGYRDYPERARVFQTLMPRERDIGAMVSFNPSFAKFLTADLAIVNGSGLSARDYDSKKDIVGNIGIKFDSLAKDRLHLGFGGSFYKGYVRSNTTTLFKENTTGFIADIAPGNENKATTRDYYGLNLQLQYDTEAGNSSFKMEYVTGSQPGVAGTPTITGPAASTSFGTQPSTSLYLRKFNGQYYWFSHKIAKTSLTALLAYDIYDPNKNVEDTEIGSLGSNTTSGDIKYATFGYGVAYEITRQIKFTLYNEHIKNEITSLPGYNADLKDNVFTARLQYRW